MDKKIKIGISGKRKITNEKDLELQIISCINEILIKEETNSFIGYSALAEGADTIFVEVVKNKFNQSVKITLPFASDEYEKDFNDSRSKSQYQKWLNLLGISAVVTKGIPKSIQAKKYAYFSLGKFLVDSCDYMIFVWDELKPNGEGGTGDILGYASLATNLKGIKIIKIKPARKEDPLHYDIVSLLQKSDQIALNFKKKHEAIWLSSIVLGWFTAFCFAVDLSFQITQGLQLILAFLELTFISIVFIFIYFIKKKKIHATLMLERVKAEKLRLLLAYYQSGLAITISDFSRQNDKKIVQVAELVNETSKTSYKSTWFEHFTIKQLLDDQIYYFTQIAKKTHRKYYILVKLNKCLYIIFVALLFSHLFSLVINFYKIYIPILSDYVYPHRIIRFFSILVP